MPLSPLEIIVIISTVLEFNPLFQAVKSVRQKSVQDLSVWTFVSIFVIGGLWLYYGITIGNIPLIVGNTIKLFTAFTVVIIYFRYKKQ